MSISNYSVNQNLADLNSHKSELTPEGQDALDRVTDDLKEILETVKNFIGDFTE